MKKRFQFILLVILLMGVMFAKADISLPAIFGDHMVLQQDTVVTVWGWAKPGEVIAITPGWNQDMAYTVEVDNQSFWSVKMETPPAGGPYNITLKGYNTIEIKDVLIGEVWLGSGQSNMEWSPAMKIDNANEERENADFPEIRFFTALTSTASVPQQHMAGKWVVCTPENMWNFSALLYFFGRELHQRLEVPVGLVHSSWGGTPIEVWIPEERILNDRLLNRNAAILKPVPWGPHEPGKAYNAMIHPLAPFQIKGALWYQGESNTANPDHYARALQTLIDSWRGIWGYDFPFYYVQIAPWNGYGADNVNGAKIRDEQRKVLAMTENTGMVVVSDIGDLEDIHPGNKQDVGKRLAAWALHYDYGFQDMPFSGPLYSSYSIEGDDIIVHFEYAVGGLETNDSKLKDFEVMDAEGKWIKVPARIKGETIVLDAANISMPSGIRFAFYNNATPDLRNKTGLPASSFQVFFED